MAQFPVIAWPAQIVAWWFDRLKNTTKSPLEIPLRITGTLIWLAKYAQFASWIMPA